MNKIFKFTVFNIGQKATQNYGLWEKENTQYENPNGPRDKAFKFLVQESCLNGLNCLESWWLPQLLV